MPIARQMGMGMKLGRYTRSRDSDPEERLGSSSEEFVKQYAQAYSAQLRGTKPSGTSVRSSTEKRLPPIKEYKDEEELIELTTHQTMVLHFYKKEFQRCQELNEALGKVALRLRHVEIACVKVENCLKMCASLKITVLPYLAVFRDGYFIAGTVGFEKFGGAEVRVCALEDYICKRLAEAEQ